MEYLKYKVLKEGGKVTPFSHPGDVGIDLHSLEDKVLEPGEHYRFYNGVAIEFPEGIAAIVKDKSSISSRGLHTMGGVFDAGYRGEVNVHLVNLSDEAYEIKKGDKIAQIVLYKVWLPKVMEVDELSESVRGERGFGSTGKQ